eukprot:352712-Chlamydomonas_euryale.AAC.5
MHASAHPPMIRTAAFNKATQGHENPGRITSTPKIQIGRLAGNTTVTSPKDPDPQPRTLRRRLTERAPTSEEQLKAKEDDPK